MIEARRQSLPVQVLVRLWLAVLASGAASHLALDADIRLVTVVIVIIVVLSGFRVRPRRPICLSAKGLSVQ